MWNKGDINVESVFISLSFFIDLIKTCDYLIVSYFKSYII